MRSKTVLVLFASTGITLAASTTRTMAQGDATALPKSTVADAGPQVATPAGLLPLPDYSGDVFHRSHLTGDWGGTRTDLAANGVQFDVDFTQYVQGITQGGKNPGARYGGTLDYLLNVDLHRMGVLQGGLFTLRAETRYGEAANDLAGSLLPVNTDGLFPLSRRLDDDIAVTITTLRYVQFLSEQLGVVVGKFDTLDSTNEFAGGRGVSQFMNGNFVYTPASAMTVPYSTLGAGVIIMPVENLTISSIVINTADSSTTSGFDDIGNGWTSLSSLEYQYKLWRLPGGFCIAGAYAADGDFTQVGGGLVFAPGQGLSLARTDSSWFFTVDGWQYLWLEDPAQDAPINIDNGRQDLQGVGVFIRAGFGDGDTNPIDYAVSFGVGDKGLIPTRDNDTIGIAYAYNRVRTGAFSNQLDIDDHSQAIEVFYDIAVTPAAHLTFDCQVIEPAQPTVETAVVVGGRLNLKF